MNPSKEVCFSDNVQIHEIPKVEIELIPEIFYSKFDYRRFKSEEKFREERAVARAIRRLVGNAVTEMDARIGSCEDVQNTERQLITQSQSASSQSAMSEIADVVAISSDEDSEEDLDDGDKLHVKPLAIRDEKIRARRRTSLLSMPSYKSHAFEDESIGLDDSHNFIDKGDLAFQETVPNLSELSFLNGSDSSIDLTFTPVEFETVIDPTGRPSISR